MTGPLAAVDSSSGKSRNSRRSCFAPAPGSNGHLRASPLAVVTNSCCTSQPPSNGPACGCRKSRFRVDGLRCRCRLTKPRCQHNTMANVTIQCSRHAWENNPAGAANTTRSAQDRRDLLTWRHNTTTSWRSITNSAFFDRELQTSSPSQVTTCRKVIRQSSHTATTGDHARRPPTSNDAGHRRG
jgi:hypothetical protein